MTCQHPCQRSHAPSNTHANATANAVLTPANTPSNRVLPTPLNPRASEAPLSALVAERCSDPKWKGRARD
jgi:hypothetical protein